MTPGTRHIKREIKRDKIINANETMNLKTIDSTLLQLGELRSLPDVALETELQVDQAADYPDPDDVEIVDVDESALDDTDFEQELDLDYEDSPVSEEPRAVEDTVETIDSIGMNVFLPEEYESIQDAGTFSQYISGGDSRVNLQQRDALLFGVAATCIEYVRATKALRQQTVAEEKSKGGADYAAAMKRTKAVRDHVNQAHLTLMTDLLAAATIQPMMPEHVAMRNWRRAQALETVVFADAIELALAYARGHSDETKIIERIGAQESFIMDRHKVILSMFD